MFCLFVFFERGFDLRLGDWRGRGNGSECCDCECGLHGPDGQVQMIMVWKEEGCTECAMDDKRRAGERRKENEGGEKLKGWERGERKEEMRKQMDMDQKKEPDEADECARYRQHMMMLVIPSRVY